MRQDLTEVEKLYSENLKKYGVQSKSVGWPDPDAHNLRFDKLIEIFEKDDQDGGISINDLGCGYGELCKYLQYRRVQVKKYIGYDISEPMINKGKEYIKDQNVEFVVNDRILQMADYSIASGIFNVKLNEDKKQWEEYIFDVLANMNQYSLKGFSFNLLSVYVDYTKPHLFYGDPLVFFDYCKKNFSKQVSLLHDYPLYEWTMLIRK